MKKTIILKTPEHFRAAITALDQLKEQDIHQLEIRPYKANLSAEQRGLYWMWIQLISLSNGDTKEGVHLMYKRRFLMPIFEREKQWFRELVESVRNVHRSGAKAEALNMIDAIVKLTSIRDANTAEMSEYMEDMRLSVQEDLGIMLPLPEDMGREQ